MVRVVSDGFRVESQECRVAMSRVSWNKFYQLTRRNPANPGSTWHCPEAWSLTSTGEAEYLGDVV